MDHVVLSKKATIISSPTKEMGMQLSQVGEREWSAQNAVFIKVYNEIVETEGLALQEWRTF